MGRHEFLERLAADGADLFTNGCRIGARRRSLQQEDSLLFKSCFDPAKVLLEHAETSTRDARPPEFEFVAFELQPHLKGELIELRPLTPEDWGELFTVASDHLIWEQHPESNRFKEDVFKIFFKEALESGGAFVVIDRNNQQIIGSTRFYGYDPQKSEIEIGWTFLARKYWGGRYNRETKDLLVAHAFKFVDSVVFFVGEKNIRSQKAMEKMGAIRERIVTRTYGNHPQAKNVKYVIRKPSKVES